MVQIAPQDAITRLSVTKLEQFEDYETIYFDEQEHISVLLLLRAQVTDCTEKKVSKRLQVGEPTNSLCKFHFKKSLLLYLFIPR